METQVHGALIVVEGLGVLLLGRSGIGKSECALELVRRGHQLVADDVVRLERTDEQSVVGTAPELIRHYMEIRGIGLLHIPDLFGETSVCNEASIGLICRLERWQEGVEYERVGFERETLELSGVAVPALVLPVRPAGNMATLIEVAARDQLQREKGESAPARLDARVRGEIERP